MIKNNFILAFSIMLISGCASAPVYDQIFKEENAYNQRIFPVAQKDLYAATIKTIYAKNFMIDKENEEKDFVVARRSFQKGKRTTILVVQAKIVGDDQAGSSTVYLSALETTERSYVSDRTRFFLFIIPLPGGGGKQASTIKEGEKVLDDKKFYKSFFDEIEKSIKETQSLVSKENSAEENKIIKTDPQ